MTNNITNIKVIELIAVNSIWTVGNIHSDYKNFNIYLLYTTNELFNNPKFQKIIEPLKNLVEMWYTQDLSKEEINEKILNIPNNTTIKWIKELSFRDDSIGRFWGIEIYSTNHSVEEKEKMIENHFVISLDWFLDDSDEWFRNFWEELVRIKEKANKWWSLSDLFDFSFDGEDSTFLQEVLKEHERIVECINGNIDGVWDLVKNAWFVAHY